MKLKQYLTAFLCIMTYDLLFSALNKSGKCDKMNSK